MSERKGKLEYQIIGMTCVQHCQNALLFIRIIFVLKKLEYNLNANDERLLMNIMVLGNFVWLCTLFYQIFDTKIHNQRWRMGI